MAKKTSEMFVLLQAHLAAATVALFSDYGFELEAAPPNPSAPALGNDTIVATIGFAGHEARGALVLAASFDAVRAWHAAYGGGAASGEPGDTIGEFSNMLLGQLKIRLLGEGLPILLSTPTTTAGGNLGAPPRNATSGWLRFHGATWDLALRLDASFEPGITLRRTTLTHPPAQAGDVMLF